MINILKYQSLLQNKTPTLLSRVFLSNPTHNLPLFCLT